MQVFKFGGASVKDARSIQKMAGLLQDFAGDHLVIVLSAIGKTTNRLEAIYGNAYQGEEYGREVEEIRNRHFDILKALFPDTCFPVFEEADQLFGELVAKIRGVDGGDYDLGYDQVISFGEMLSTSIISAYLNYAGFSNQWLDVRKLLKTDDNYRAASVDWDLSSRNIRKAISFNGTGRYITQGFIAGGAGGHTTTLGREGSDYSAALFANMLNAESLTIWKDVPGILNADPKLYQRAVFKVDELNYQEALELTFFGAKIIHPKTIRPLQHKNIPLHVKSYTDHRSPGTLIHGGTISRSLPEFHIIKKDQVLFTCASRDFSFMDERIISYLYKVFADHNLTINLIQIFALEVKICVAYDRMRVDHISREIRKHLDVEVLEQVEFQTLRHFGEETIQELMASRHVLLLEIGTRNAHFVIRPA